ncbi:MAG: hypothetical protein ACYTHM_19405 [Planctomycetota bacterium]|jgi:hypothetical protein
MDRAGIAYERHDNCFVSLDDVSSAQKLADRQVRTRWETHLNRIARQVNPALPRILGRFHFTYYWSLLQSEWATDILFDDPNHLAAIYRPLVRHGITGLSSGDVMRFLGGKVHGCFGGQIVSDFKYRPKGIRIKHRVKHNSVKLYDKQGTPPLPFRPKAFRSRGSQEVQPPRHAGYPVASCSSSRTQNSPYPSVQDHPKSP